MHTNRHPARVCLTLTVSGLWWLWDLEGFFRQSLSLRVSFQFSERNGGQLPLISGTRQFRVNLVPGVCLPSM